MVKPILKRALIFQKKSLSGASNLLKSLSVGQELRTLVNVIKHSEGESEKDLREMRPDFFEHYTGSEKYDLLSLYHSTLLEAMLQIEEKDFINHYDALVAFWNELPERMCSKISQ